MINLHDLYLSTIEATLEAQKLSLANQPAGDKPAGVLWAMPSTSTRPDVIIAYEFTPMSVSFDVTSRDAGRSFHEDVHYAGGIEGFLKELVKFINAGRLAAPAKR